MAKLLDTRELCAIVGKSRCTIWRWERKAAFPRRVRIGANSVAWIAEEVDEWIRLKAEERLLSEDDPDDINQ